MAQNLYDAHQQWAKRLPDERFSSLTELYSFVKDRKDASKQYIRPLEQISLNVTPEGAITVNEDSKPALLSNWAFGQLSRTIGAPAKYLRSLPPKMACDCLLYGLRSNNQTTKLLIREEQPQRDDYTHHWASAFTGQSYGRIWDADVVENLIKAIDCTSWRLPDNQNLNRSGLYASDRDFFAFMINDEKPVEIGNAKLGKGFFCWNSETGASTFGLTTFLYNYVCQNHIVWGAEEVNELKIYHRNNAINNFYNNAIPILNRFVENSKINENIKYSLDKAMNQPIADNIEETQEWFKNKPFTKKEIANAWETGIAEGEDVSNLWGMIQGLTAYARDMPYGNKRVNLEKRAGALLD